MVVCNLEDQRKHSRLRIVQIEQPTEQKWTHFADSRAHGMPLLAEHVPERHRRGFISKVVDAEFLGSFGDLRAFLSLLADSRQVALHVRGEYRHAGAAKCLGHDLKRDCFPGSGCSGNESMAICHLR